MFLASDAPSSPALAVYSSFQPPCTPEPAREGIEFLPCHPFLPGLPARLLTGKKDIGARWAAARELHKASGMAGTLAEGSVWLPCGKGPSHGCRSKMWEHLLPYPPATATQIGLLCNALPPAMLPLQQILSQLTWPAAEIQTASKWCPVRRMRDQT